MVSVKVSLIRLIECIFMKLVAQKQPLTIKTRLTSGLKYDKYQFTVKNAL